MNRVAKELTAASDGLKEYLRFTFDDVDPKAADFVNSICSEIDDLADRIRRNEGLELKVERDSQDDGTKVRVLMSDHEAMKAIREEMIEKLGKLGKKKKLKVTVGSARKILGIAREIMAIDFPSQDAFDEYMKEHPEGDKANHRVVETKPEVRQKQPVEIKPEVKQSVPVVSKPEKTEKEEIEERKKLRIKGKKTKEFKSWFGDWESNPEKASKIVDNEGQPLPLLHGSDEADIKEFDASKAKSSLGIFFTADRDVAKEYGKHVYRAYLNIRKPADFREESVLKKVYKHSSLKSEGYSYDQIQQMHDEGTFWMEEGNDRVQRTVIASAKSLGYDGIIMTDSYGGQTSATDTSWIVFDGNQIMLGGQVEKLGKTGTATAPKPKVKKKLGPFDEWAIYRTKDYDGNPVKPHLDLSVQQMISGLSEKSASALLKSAVATKKETGKLKGDEDEKVKEMVKKFVDNMNPNDFSSREEYEAAKKRLIEEKPWVIYDILDQGLHP